MLQVLVKTNFLYTEKQSVGDKKRPCLTSLFSFERNVKYVYCYKETGLEE